MLERQQGQFHFGFSHNFLPKFSCLEVFKYLLDSLWSLVLDKGLQLQPFLLVIFFERRLSHHAIPSRLPFSLHMLDNSMKVFRQFFFVDLPEEFLKLKDFPHYERIVDIILFELVDHHDHVVLEISRRGVHPSKDVVDDGVEIHRSADTL